MRDEGICTGYVPRFYFNKELGRCELFSYGGCGGNNNNFETEEECAGHCGGPLGGHRNEQGENPTEYATTYANLEPKKVTVLIEMTNNSFKTPRHIISSYDSMSLLWVIEGAITFPMSTTGD